MALFLHPKANVAEAAIHAYDHGARLETKDGVIKVERGRDPVQYRKALKVQALQRAAALFTKG